MYQILLSNYAQSRMLGARVGPLQGATPLHSQLRDDNWLGRVACLEGVQAMNR